VELTTANRPSPDEANPRPSLWLGAIALVALVLVAYLPAITSGWVWDDDSYVTANPLLDPALPAQDALTLIWTPGATPQYYPAVFTSFLIESRLYLGLAPEFADGDIARVPLGFHLVNVLLHALSAVLLWRLLRILNVPGAWFAAAIFALHPMNVESVAWITERKNVLALAFGLGSIMAWLRAWPRAGEAIKRHTGWLIVSFSLFVLAMLSKTTIAAVAPAILLIHLWRRDRLVALQWTVLATFFAIGIALGLHTAHLERTHVGAEGDEFLMTFAQRCALAPRSLLFYVWTFLWPSRLAFIYPRWTIDPLSVVTWLPLVVTLSALGACALAWWRGWRGPLVLALLTVAGVFPALGFIDVYPFRYSYVADHFAYLATIPLAITAAWLLKRLTRALTPKVAMTVATVLVIALGSLTAAQSVSFHDEKTLWQSSLASNPDAWMPLSNLAGLTLREAGAALDAGDVERGKSLAIEAETGARRATELSDRQATAWTNLSEALRLQARLSDALVASERALALEADDPQMHWRRGRLHELLGNLPAAAVDYQTAVERPDRSRELIRRGSELRQRRLDLARAFTRLNRNVDAIAVFETMLKDRPDDALAAANLARVKVREGDVKGAREAFRAALMAAPETGFAIALLPGFVDVLLAAPSDVTLALEAIDAATWLNDRTGGSDPLVLVLLARARAADGELDVAKKLLDDARVLATDAPSAVRDEIARRAAEIDLLR